MKINTILIFAFLFLMACQPSADTNEKQTLIKVNGMEIDETVLSKIMESIGKEYKYFEKINWRYLMTDTVFTEVIDTFRNGLVFSFVDETKAKEMYKEYHEILEKQGCYIFLTHLDFDKSWKCYYDVAIVNAKDQFELLKIMNTNGINYDIDNDQVINKLQQWHKEVDFEIYEADEDRVGAFMNKSPKDIVAFTKDVYEFCPDVIDQGYGSMEEMIKDYQTNKFFWLWWD